MAYNAFNNVSSSNCVLEDEICGWFSNLCLRQNSIRQKQIATRNWSGKNRQRIERRRRKAKNEEGAILLDVYQLRVCQSCVTKNIK